MHLFIPISTQIPDPFPATSDCAASCQWIRSSDWYINTRKTPSPIGSISIWVPLAAFLIEMSSIQRNQKTFVFFPGILLLWVASSVGRLFNCLSPSAAFINKPAEISPLAWGAGVERPCFLGMSAILHNWQQNPYLQERHILRPPANNQMLSSAKSGRSRGSLPTKNALHSGNGLKLQIKVEQIDAVINILHIT